MPTMINEENNIAYLHFSKTGGWFVTRMLRQDNWNIVDIKTKGGHLGVHELNENVFTFGFIRHPFEWYKSLYNYFWTCDFNNGIDDFNHLRCHSLDEFIIKSKDGFNLSKIYNIFFGIDTDKECNEILKYEDMHKELPKLLSRFGMNYYEYISKNKNHYVNKSVQQSGCNLSKKSTDYIINSCHQIFERFNYDKVIK